MASLSMMFGLLLGISLCVTVKSQGFNQCNGKADGTITSFTCNKYTFCQQGLPQDVTCGQGQVFERSSGTCIVIGSGDTDCGLTSNACGVAGSGLFTDEAFGCQTFYQCVNGLAFPRQYCGSGTVFDASIQTCSLIANVDPPCGTNGETGSDEVVEGDGERCIGEPDGTIIPYNCDTYIQCSGGVELLINCPQGQIFERDSSTCKQIGKADTDCGFPAYDCYGETSVLRTDKRYECQTYYRCENNVFESPRQYCDFGQVFNMDTQQCDLAINVPSCFDAGLGSY